MDLSAIKALYNEARSVSQRQEAELKQAEINAKRDADVISKLSTQINSYKGLNISLQQQVVNLDQQSVKYKADIFRLNTELVEQARTHSIISQKLKDDFSRLLQTSLEEQSRLNELEMDKSSSHVNMRQLQAGRAECEQQVLKVEFDLNAKLKEANSEIADLKAAQKHLIQHSVSQAQQEYQMRFQKLCGIRDAISVELKEQKLAHDAVVAKLCEEPKLLREEMEKLKITHQHQLEQQKMEITKHFDTICIKLRQEPQKLAKNIQELKKMHEQKLVEIRNKAAAITESAIDKMETDCNGKLKRIANERDTMEKKMNDQSAKFEVLVEKMKKDQPKLIQQLAGDTIKRLETALSQQKAKSKQDISAIMKEAAKEKARLSKVHEEAIEKLKSSFRVELANQKLVETSLRNELRIIQETLDQQLSQQSQMHRASVAVLVEDSGATIKRLSKKCEDLQYQLESVSARFSVLDASYNELKIAHKKQSEKMSHCESTLHSQSKEFDKLRLKHQHQSKFYDNFKRQVYDGLSAKKHSLSVLKHQLLDIKVQAFETAGSFQSSFKEVVGAFQTLIDAQENERNRDSEEISILKSSISELESRVHDQQLEDSTEIALALSASRERITQLEAQHRIDQSNLETRLKNKYANIVSALTAEHEVTLEHNKGLHEISIAKLKEEHEANIENIIFSARQESERLIQSSAALQEEIAGLKRQIRVKGSDPSTLFEFLLRRSLLPQSIAVPDDYSDHCTICRRQFRMMLRRHHCRACGMLFCWECSGDRLIVPGSSDSSYHRVCDICSAKICNHNGKTVREQSEGDQGDNLLPHHQVYHEQQSEKFQSSLSTLKFPSTTTSGSILQTPRKSTHLRHGTALITSKPEENAITRPRHSSY